jgi:hypothetical protein
MWRQKKTIIYEGVTEKKDADSIPGITELRSAAALTDTKCSSGPNAYNNALEKGAAFSAAQLADRGKAIHNTVMREFANCINNELKPSESLYKSTCTSAIQAAKQFGDTVDDPQNLRTDMVAQITNDMAPIDESLLSAPNILNRNDLTAGASLFEIKKPRIVSKRSAKFK